MIRCDECREWFHGRCVNITPEEAEQMDAYQCPGCSASTGVHVSMVTLHSQVNLFQMDKKEQTEKQASGDGSPPSSPLQPAITEEVLIVTVPEEELRGLDPEVQGNSGPTVKVGGEGGILGEGGESEGGSEDATGGEVEMEVRGKKKKKRNQKRKDRDRRRRAAKRRNKAEEGFSPSIQAASPQGDRVEAQGQSGVCRGQPGFPALSEVETPRFVGQGGAVGVGLSCPVSGCEALGPGLKGTFWRNMWPRCSGT
ncbi:PHF2 [Mytilus coruscus]|uniref:PHF2 n=1 Tax=Mytilus coruscus TaxID=42192 RepID=A0A6J8CPY4_MYTCO|nr:PHF2 [Mytilus coruscus]